MSNVPENVDPETGEVLEDGIESITIKHGNQEVTTTPEGLRGAAEQTKKAVIMQEQLFETHPIEQIITNLKAACISGVDVESGKTRIPKQDDRGYFLVAARVNGVLHKRDKDYVMVRTVTFEAQEIHEVDEVTVKRFLKQTDR